MAVLLKLVCRGEVFRVQLQEGEVTYSQVVDTIQRAWPELGVHTATYQDSEGDSCTLCALTMSDCLAEAREVGGRKVLRLEITPAGKSSASSCTAPAAASSFDEQHMAFKQGMLKGWKGMWSKGKALGKGKHHRGAWGGCEGVSWSCDPWGAEGSALSGNGDNERGAWRLRRLLRVLAHLRSSSTLSGVAVASLAVHQLPAWISKVADDLDAVEHELRKVLPLLQPVLEDLSALVARTPGLEHCEAPLRALTPDSAASAAEALMTLLAGVRDLPLEDRVAFLETCYSSQEARLQQLLDWIESWTPGLPSVPAEHADVTCDGCSAYPLRGLRFKCKECPNFDLCADCFTKKDDLHSFDDCAGHSFRCIPIDRAAAWHRGCGAWGAKGAWALNMVMKKGSWCKGKAKGKGKGKWRAHEDDTEWRIAEEEGKAGGDDASVGGEKAWKGCKGKGGQGKHKGKCKGVDGAAVAGKVQGEDTLEQDAGEQRPCEAGCGFMATWHATHCCKACAKGKGSHGPKCERKALPSTDEATIDRDRQVVEDEGKAGSEDASVLCDSGKACEGKSAKGKAKGKGNKGKGKGKCDDRAEVDGSVPGESTLEQAAGEQRPCEAGCGFMATWHATHCCKACAKGKGNHGPKCERKALMSADASSIPAPEKPSQEA